MISNSVRRFSGAIGSAVFFSLLLPKPAATRRLASTPSLLTRNSTAACARCSLSFWLKSASPSALVCPSIRSLISGCFSITLARSCSTNLAASGRSALPASNYAALKFSSIFSISCTYTVSC